jgi:hypothetical protein
MGFALMLAGGPASAQGTPSVDVVMLADRLADTVPWPGFDPRRIPVAVYDGERTWLFRHPAPPEGFEAVAPSVLPANVAGQDVRMYEGRHPAVTANTSIELGGHATATLLADSTDASALQRAGTLIHEAFHVFQRARHPRWSANEADLFTYPVDDADVLAATRLELQALRRALGTEEHDRSACWAREAMELRADRFAMLPAVARAYERGTELNEGLATYVEHRATGRMADGDVVPPEPSTPEAVRQRGYRTGLALARLLDRFSRGWQQRLEADDGTPLDALLTEALRALPAEKGACGFSVDERETSRSAAVSDVAVIRTARAKARDEFLSQPGWRLVVEANEAPLFPQGFDPLNVRVVDEGEVLHARYLKLAGEGAAIEVMGRASLTRAAGTHPLFNGVRTLTVTGIDREPVVSERDGALAFQAEGISGTFRNAVVDRVERVITVRLP